MRVVLAAAACVAAFASAAPAVAQATAFTASNFSLLIDKKPVNAARSIEFIAATAVPNAIGRGAAGPTPFTLKATITRTADRTFDDWGAQSGALRNVQINFMDRAGKLAGGYELDRCMVLGWTWSLDATNNALATETWTIACGTAVRS